MLLMLWMFSDQADESKYIQLYNTYNQILLSVAFKLLHNQQDAEDCVSDTFEKISEVLENTPEKIGAVDARKTANYLITITSNNAKNMLRRKERRNSVYSDEFSKEISELDNPGLYSYNLVELRHDMKVALSLLEEKYRTPLIMFYYQDLSISEIAELLDISENHVSVLLWRAKSKLKTIMEKGGL